MEGSIGYQQDSYSQSQHVLYDKNKKEEKIKLISNDDGKKKNEILSPFSGRLLPRVFKSFIFQVEALFNRLGCIADGGIF